MDTFYVKCNETPSVPQENFKKGGIFLDRDGTIIAERHYLKEIKQLELLPEVVQGLKLLKQTKLPLYLVTNQAGVAHGHFTEETVDELHQYLVQFLKQFGISLRGILYCPHHPTAEIETYRTECSARKPEPGLLKQAATHDGLNLNKSYLIGDKLSDIMAGNQVGSKTILVLSGYGASEAHRIGEGTLPKHIALNFYQAAQWIVKDWRKTHMPIF